MEFPALLRQALENRAASFPSLAQDAEGFPQPDHSGLPFQADSGLQREPAPVRGTAFSRRRTGATSDAELPGAGSTNRLRASGRRRRRRLRCRWSAAGVRPDNLRGSEATSIRWVSRSCFLLSLAL